MRIWFATIFVLCFASCFAQNVPDVQSLYTQLNQPANTNSAAQQLHDLAAKDSVVRDYMAQKLPAMISAGATGDWHSVTLQWMNAVRLAGQLKLETTIPALIESLSRNPVRGGYDMQAGIGYTSSRGAKLQFDIVARALADIGDPAVPSVAGVSEWQHDHNPNASRLDSEEYRFSKCTKSVERPSPNRD